MNIASLTPTAFALCAAMVACAGCTHAPGYPKPGAEISRPDEELNFQALYKQNCAGCHGENGRNGAALPLNNPAYLAVAGAENIHAAAASGVSGTLMPGFARSAGGMLTGEQIDAIVQGMLHTWAQPSEFASVNLPPYSSSAAGNPADGQRAYALACARCHGPDGTGVNNPSQRGASHDSIVDPSYLALVSNQSLRSIVIAGHPGKNMPDWRSYIAGPDARPLSPKEINDIVAWVAEHRTSTVNEQAMSNPHGHATGVSGKERK
jgi:mono/diheme cytochrome c family protein